MINFNYEDAKNGKPVQTRDGRKVRIICYDSKVEHKPIIALVECADGSEVIVEYDKDGKLYCDKNDKGIDLIMVPEKQERWGNLYRHSNNAITINGISASKEEAKYFKMTDVPSRTYIDTIKIEWEE